jgi:tetratricopeptide (TPR) repeat protein
MKVQTDDRLQYGYTKFASRYQRYEAWGQVAQLYEHSLAQNPRDISLLRDIAQMYRKFGDEQKLKEYSEKAMAIDLPRFKRYPTWVSVNLSLAKTYALIDDKVEVKRHLDNALFGARNKVKKAPDSASAAYWLGKTHDQRGEFRAAAQQYKRALEFKPGNSKYQMAYKNVLLHLKSTDTIPESKIQLE